MNNLKCYNCGRDIETIPLSCGLSININRFNNEWECDLGNCGVRSIDKILCSNCCSNLA